MRPDGEGARGKAVVDVPPTADGVSYGLNDVIGVESFRRGGMIAATHRLIRTSTDCEMKHTPLLQSVSVETRQGSHYGTTEKLVRTLEIVGQF